MTCSVGVSVTLLGTFSKECYVVDMIVNVPDVSRNVCREISEQIAQFLFLLNVLTSMLFEKSKRHN